MNHRLLLRLLLVASLLSGAPVALGAAEPGAERVHGPIVAAPGVPLILFSDGALTVEGALGTVAVELPGGDGPDVLLRSRVAVVLRDVEIRAADGVSGAGVERVGPAFGGFGGRGGSIIIEAPRILMENATLIAGKGGSGGGAVSLGVPHALAVGGDGGPGGRVVFFGAVQGAFVARDGDGGDGGDATARGRPGESCNGVEGTPDARQGRNGTVLSPAGQDAKANAGDGACGPWDGEGGPGGDARAFGGNGNISASGKGGRGGDATAIAGRGGDGRSACFDSQEEAAASGITHAGNGGIGGRYFARGGRGGNSTNEGGDGGDAYTATAAGHGGNATIPIQPGTWGDRGSRRGADPFDLGASGGDGGTGLIGGNGGGAHFDLFGGDAGSYCGPGPKTTPGLPVALTLCILIALAVIREKNRRD